jgi:hypothetical protein
MSATVDARCIQLLLSAIDKAESAARTADALIYDGHDPDYWSRLAQSADEIAEASRKEARKLLSAMLPGVDLEDMFRKVAP